MKGDILLIIIVSSNGTKIVAEYKTTRTDLSPEVGYVLDDFSDFKMVKWDEGITSEYGSLDEEKAFKTPGIYQIDCNWYEGSEPENGWYSEYRVLDCKRVADLPYVI